MTHMTACHTEQLYNSSILPIYANIHLELSKVIKDQRSLCYSTVVRYLEKVTDVGIPLVDWSWKLPCQANGDCYEGYWLNVFLARLTKVCVVARLVV